MTKVKCKFCSKRSKDFESFRLIHFSCIKCHSTFISKPETLSHFKEYHLSISMAKFENKAQCNLCTYIGRDKRSLQSHSQKNHQHCLECDVKYETKEDIMFHLNKFHDYEPKKYKSFSASRNQMISIIYFFFCLARYSDVIFVFPEVDLYNRILISSQNSDLKKPTSSPARPKL